MLQHSPYWDIPLSYHQVDSCFFIGWLLTRYIPYPTPGAPYLVSKQVRMRASASWQQQAEISVFLSSAIFTIFVSPERDYVITDSVRSM